MQGRQILQWVYFLAAPDAEDRSADEKQREIAAHFGRYAQLVFGGELRVEFALQAEHCSDCVRRRRAQAALHGKLLVNLNDNLATLLHLMFLVLKGHGLSRAAKDCFKIGL